MKRYYINNKNIENWKQDVLDSVLFYNEWFLNFAPSTYIDARQNAINKVESAFQKTRCFNQISTEILKVSPEIITILRLSTTPPLALDRLAGLSNVSRTIIKTMEEGKLPRRLAEQTLETYLNRVVQVINRLLDIDIMPWLSTQSLPNDIQRLLATNVIGDRVCGSLADPIIRNEQERRQLRSINNFLTVHGYKFVESKNISDFKSMKEGTFSYHLNVPIKIDVNKTINMPIDVVVKRKNSDGNELPILIECKSAGDFTNTNKRRKEEAIKIGQLKNTYGDDIEFILFLCGYFDSGYLGYEAAEGIDWIWEHRIEDFQKANI